MPCAAMKIQPEESKYNCKISTEYKESYIEK